MKKQKGYLLVTVAFAVLLTAFVLTMAMQISNVNHHKAMTAFTSWRVQASTESALSPIISGLSYYNLAAQPMQQQINDTVLSPLRDSKIKVVKKVYKLDTSPINLSPYFYQDSYQDPAYSKTALTNTTSYPEVATNIRETHVIGFSVIDTPLYEACVKNGFTEEVTIAPKADVVFDENPSHTLSACLKSKGADITHLYQINYGVLNQNTSNDAMVVN